MPGTARSQIDRRHCSQVKSPATSTPPPLSSPIFRGCAFSSQVKVDMEIGEGVGVYLSTKVLRSVHDLIAVDRRRECSSHKFFPSVHWPVRRLDSAVREALGLPGADTGLGLRASLFLPHWKPEKRKGKRCGGARAEGEGCDRFRGQSPSRRVAVNCHVNDRGGRSRGSWVDDAQHWFRMLHPDSRGA
jgi:hypothetical protein